MATRAELDAAARAGLRLVTHLYNAMRPFHHREEGVVDGALVDDRLACALIYDRQHVSRGAAEIALRAKPRDRVLLASDATAALEAPDGEIDVDGTRYVIKDGKVTVRGTGRLAGSACHLLQCVRMLGEDLGLPIERAWELGAANPARLLGLEHAKGAIAPEYDADLVVLEEGGKVRSAVAMGRIVHGDHHPA
jgi:N-acetylglucosamine-6-phosphate deacetylase